MSVRKRKQQAQRAAARAADPLPTAKPASNRSTFRVAQAQRQLAAELPGVVRNRQAEKQAAASRPAPLSSPAPVRQGEAKRSPSAKVQTTRAEQPKLDRADLDLKCRPKSQKPSSGGGSGRSFVPWGNC